MAVGSAEDLLFFCDIIVPVLQREISELSVLIYSLVSCTLMFAVKVRAEQSLFVYQRCRLLFVGLLGTGETDVSRRVEGSEWTVSQEEANRGKLTPADIKCTL